MVISLKAGDVVRKNSTSLILCKLLLFSIFIPSRGRFLGVSFGVNLVLLVCMLTQFLISRKILLDYTRYMVVYIMITVLGYLAHFTGIQPLFIAMLRLVTPFYVMYYGITDRESFDSMLRYIVRMFTVYSLFGIVECVTLFNIFDKITHSKVVYEHANALRFGLARSRGALEISINNGMLMCLVLCIAAYVLINVSESQKLFYRICYMLIFLDTFLTLSRAVWMELVVTQLLIFLVLSSKEKWKIIRRILIIGVIGVLLVYLVKPDLITKMFYIANEMFSSTYDAVSGSDTSEATDMSYGVGHRVLLWQWVWEKAQGSLLLGKGHATPFLYISPGGYVKESIEVMWLYLFYHTGFIGAFGYIVFQIGVLRELIVGFMQERKVEKEKSISFNYVILVATLLYFFTQFSCSGFEDLRFFYMLVAIVIAYNKIIRSEN